MEEVEDSDLFWGLADPEDELVFRDGGVTILLQPQNRVVAKRIAFGHRPEVAQGCLGLVRKPRRRDGVAEVALDVRERVAELLFRAGGEKDLIHSVPRESRRAPQKRPLLDGRIIS